MNHHFMILMQIIFKIMVCHAFRHPLEQQVTIGHYWLPKLRRTSIVCKVHHRHTLKRPTFGEAFPRLDLWSCAN